MSGRSREQGLGQGPAPQYGPHDGPGASLVASASGTSTSTSTIAGTTASSTSTGTGTAPRPTSSTYGSFPSSSRLLSASTFTYIASWRGQLLICFIAVILSLLFFLIQRPYNAWRTSRQEARSRSMTAELLRSEAERSGQETKRDVHAMVHAEDKGAGGKVQAKEKKHQAKKRKGSLLHAPTAGSASATASATTSSIETSPAPNTKGLPPVASASKSTPAKPRQRATSSISTAVSTPTPPGPDLHPRRVSATSASSSPTLRIHLREPSTDAADSLVVPPPASRPVAPSHRPDPDIPAWTIPLPVSPLAATSGLDYAASDVSHDAEADGEAEGEAEGEGEGEGEDEAGSSAAERPVKSEGWSIWPEEGYLPAPQPLHGKKKKKRAKHASVMSPSNPLATSTSSPQAVAGPSHQQPESAGASTSTEPSGHPVGSPSQLSRPEHASASAGSAASAASGSDGTPGKYKHSRKASLGRPRNMELQELLDLRESMLDALRADVGMARAEQAKAKDDADRARASEDRARAELDRLRKSINRADVDSRRREGDLQNNFNQLQLTYNAMLHRLTTLETMMRDSGMAFPPASPGIPNMPGAHTPHRLSLGHSSLSVPASPFQMGFASPVPGHGSPMMPYSPGMMPPGAFPSHFLHPNYPSHLSPSPQRRLSAHELSLASGEILAGPLTPGHLGVPSPGHSPYPPEIAQSHVASPAPEGLPSGMSPAEYRRVSIESSVLKKKKTPPLPGSEDDSAGVVASGSGSGAEAINEEADEAGSSGVGSNNPPGDVQGLGVGEIDAVPSAFTGPVTDPSSRAGSSTSSHPTSPSQRPAPVTPAGSDLYRTLSTGAESTKQGGASLDYPATPGEPEEAGCAGGSSLEPSRPASADGASRIRVVSDGEGGNVYYRESEASGASASASASGTNVGSNELEMTPYGKASGLQVPSTLDVFTGSHQSSSNSSWADLDDDDEDDEDDGIIHEPTFASLAHTEEQKREIARRERIVRRHSAQRARGASAGGVGAGSGSGSGSGSGAGRGM